MESEYSKYKAQKEQDKFWYKEDDVLLKTELSDSNNPFVKPKSDSYLVPETNFEYNEQGYIVFDEDRYYPARRFYRGYPRITGMPEISYQLYNVGAKRNKFTRQMSYYITKTPKKCSLLNIVNHDIKTYGSLQVGIMGNYMTGKSNFLDFLMTLLMAMKHRFLMWDDSPFEARTLAAHGFFDKNDEFHPYQLFIWIPKGYKFDESAENHNPMFKTGKNTSYRKNVQLREFSSPNQIIDNLKPHKLNIVYSDAFDEHSSLRLLNDCSKEIKRRTSIWKSYILACHEFADLFPESPSGDLYHIMRESEKLVKRFRKDRVGLVTNFHEKSDVKYTISNKLSYIIQKQPVNKQAKSPLEKYASRFGISQMAISTSGYFREHTVTKFPEVQDKYRLIPNPKPYVYKDGEVYEYDGELPENTFKASARQCSIMYINWLNGVSQREAAKAAGVSRTTVRVFYAECEQNGE